MPFKKGNKEGGRTKGAENKLNKEAKELFIETLEGQVINIKDAFDKVREESASKYLELFAKYAMFFAAKKTESEVKTTLSTDFNFNDTLKMLKSGKD